MAANSATYNDRTQRITGSVDWLEVDDAEIHEIVNLETLEGGHYRNLYGIRLGKIPRQGTLEIYEYTPPSESESESSSASDSDSDSEDDPNEGPEYIEADAGDWPVASGEFACSYEDDIVYFHSSKEGSFVRVRPFEFKTTVPTLEELRRFINQVVEEGGGLGGGGGNGGQSGKNYVTNPDAEDDVTTGVGVSAGTVSITAEESNHLAGARSFLIQFSGHSVGDYAYFDLDTIDLIDRGSLARLRLAKNDGTGYVASDAEIVYYDGATEHAVIISDDTNEIPEGLAWLSGYITIPESAASGGQLRVKALTTGHDFALILDAITFGPFSLVLAAAHSDTQPFTPVVDATITAPTIDSGTIDTNAGFWRRSADHMIGRIEYRHRAANSGNGSGTYLWEIPNGLSIDLAKVTAATTDANGDIGIGIVGSGQVNASTDYTIHVHVYDARRLWISYQANPVGTWDSSTFGVWTESALEFSFDFAIPIAGWSSRVAIAENAIPEVVSNSDTTSGSDTSSYQSGSALVPNRTSIAGNSVVTKQVQLSRVYKYVSLMFKEDGSGGWVPSGAIFPYHNDRFDAGGTIYQYGVSLERVSDTKYNVTFGVAGCYRKSATIRAWSDEYSAGTLWAVIGHDDPMPVEAPTSAQVVRLYDSKSSGSAGGSFTSGAWRTRDLNTLSNPLSLGWVSLASNEFTLTPGKYVIEWEAPAYIVATHQSRLYNVSDSSVEVTGGNALSGGGDATQTVSKGRAIVSISAHKSFRIEHRCQTTRATNGFGAAMGGFSPDEEIYTQVEIQKIA